MRELTVNPWAERVPIKIRICEITYKWELQSPEGTVLWTYKSRGNFGFAKSKSYRGPQNRTRRDRGEGKYEFSSGNSGDIQKTMMDEMMTMAAGLQIPNTFPTFLIRGNEQWLMPEARTLSWKKDGYTE